MKIPLMLAIALLGAFSLSGCTTLHSFYYDYDELNENLVKVEIVYMEESVDIFSIHSYLDIKDTDYKVIRELTYNETAALVQALTNIAFAYSRLRFPPVAPSSIAFIQGYAFKLHYETGISDESNPFIIVARTGDYRYGLLRFHPVRIGRTATYEDWNALVSKFNLE